MYSLRYTFDTIPTRVHFSLPEELYVHPDNKTPFPFRVGYRYFVKWSGDNGRYFEDDSGSIISAYKNPIDFKLDVEPIPKMSKLESRLYYGVAGWIEEWFHLVEFQSDNDASKTYKARERCEGRGCKWCADDWPKVFGRRFYSTIAPKYWNEAIYSAQESIEKACQCGGDIFVPEYVCPKCEQILVDVFNSCEKCGAVDIPLDPERREAECPKCNNVWSVDESDNSRISKLVNNEMTCEHCGEKEILPKPIQICSTEGCKVLPWGAFDSQLTIKMSSKDRKSAEMNVSDVKIQEPDPRLFDPKYQGIEGGQEDAEKQAEWMKKPLNLNEIFAGDPPETQAQQLSVANPFGHRGGGGAQGGFRSYNRDKNEEAEQ